MNPEVVGGTSQVLKERRDGRSLSASPPPCRRRCEETLYLSLSLRRSSDERSQSLVTSSPPGGNGTSLAQRLGPLPTSLDLRGLHGLRIRRPHQQPREARLRLAAQPQRRQCARRTEELDVAPATAGLRAIGDGPAGRPPSRARLGCAARACVATARPSSAGSQPLELGRKVVGHCRRFGRHCSPLTLPGTRHEVTHACQRDTSYHGTRRPCAASHNAYQSSCSSVIPSA